MINYHTILGAFSVLIGVIGYFPYFSGLAKKTIKPHVFSWMVWSFSTGIVFIAQVVKGGGTGSWAMGAFTILQFLVFIIAIFRGEKEVTCLDKISLGVALFSMVLWFVTASPVYSVILITAMDILGYVPTIRKAWKKPNEEAVSVFVMGGISIAISILALQAFNIVTFLYPVALLIANTVLVSAVLVKRKQLRVKT
jgi:hypothetical protein